MKIDRVILSSDLHPDYLPFWNLTSKAWSTIIGIKPTLALIADEIPDGLDTTYGEIHLVKPIEGIPTARQAQIVRFFLPSQFPEEVCLTSDIDMLPLSKDYFTTVPRNVDDNHLAVYSSDSTLPGFPNHPSFAVGYNAAKGKVFEEIVQGNMDNFEEKIREWVSHGHGWFTDEVMFYNCWQQWPDKLDKTKLFKRGFNITPDPTHINRIDRSNNCLYYQHLLKVGFYYDFHMPRPYEEHKDKIHEILNILTNNKFFIDIEHQIERKVFRT
tara:strand:+ start:2176 stop:2985 length:810 start_codon:yes stop_codon:yes gene_type:complete